MFQNVDCLISIEFIPEENEIVKINSMISTFEGCENLEYFINKGFNTDEVISLHKLFFESGLTYINFNNFLSTKNVEDMSYLFSY